MAVVASLPLASPGDRIPRGDAPIETRFPTAPADLLVHSWRGKGEMVIELEAAFDAQLDPGLLSRAVELLLDGDPILGCRLVVEGRPPYWQRLPPAECRVLTVVASAREYERARDAGLDPTVGAPLALCLWQRPGGDRLLITMSHEVGDGWSLQAVAYELSRLYSRLDVDGSYRPAPTPPADRDVTQVLRRVPPRHYPRVLWDFLRFLVPRSFPRRTHALPLPPESTGRWVPVVRQLQQDQLAALAAYGHARNATLNDLLLAAMYRALATHGGWDGASALRVSITIDLRRWYLPAGASGPTCNLSSFDCPFLVRDLGGTFDETLARVNALMRRRKESRPGLAVVLIARLLLKFQGIERLAQTSRRSVMRQPRRARPMTLSNEGILDRARLQFSEHAPVAAHILPPFMRLPNLHVSFSTYRDVLTLSTVTSENGQTAVGTFLDAIIEQLPLSASREVAARSVSEFV